MALMEGDYAYPVNLGNPSEYTIRQFAELITEITNSTKDLALAPLISSIWLLQPSSFRRLSPSSEALGDLSFRVSSSLTPFSSYPNGPLF